MERKSSCIKELSLVTNINILRKLFVCYVCLHDHTLTQPNCWPTIFAFGTYRTAGEPLMRRCAHFLFHKIFEPTEQKLLNLE
jgi:hypothetical protein